MASVLISYPMVGHLDWIGMNMDNDTCELMAALKGLNPTCKSSKSNESHRMCRHRVSAITPVGNRTIYEYLLSVKLLYACCMLLIT